MLCFPVADFCPTAHCLEILTERNADGRLDFRGSCIKRSIALGLLKWSGHVAPFRQQAFSGRKRPPGLPYDRERPSPLQMFVAFPPIATALLDPFQAAIGVDCFVGFVLIGTSFEARLVGLLVGIGR